MIRAVVRDAVERANGDEHAVVQIVEAWLDAAKSEDKRKALGELMEMAGPSKVVQPVVDEAVQRFDDEEAALNMITEKLDRRENPEFHAEVAGETFGDVMRALAQVIREQIGAWKQRQR